jgi:hypothetical protein
LSAPFIAGTLQRNDERGDVSAEVIPMAAEGNGTKVTIFTGSYRIKGYVDLLPGARLTDYMTEAKDFIAVTNAEVYEAVLGGRQVLTAPFINVSREHVQLVAPGH